MQSVVTGISAGFRYTDRKKSQFARSDYRDILVATRAPIPANLLRGPITGFGSFSNMPPTLDFDTQGVIDQVFGGINPQQKDYDAPKNYVVEEDLIAGYVGTDLVVDLFETVFSGNAGVRIVRTEIASSSSLLQNGEVVPVSVNNDFTDVLPTFNMSF